MMKRMMQLQLPNGQAHTIDLTTGAITRKRLEFPGEVDCSLNLGHAWETARCIVSFRKRVVPALLERKRASNADSVSPTRLLPERPLLGAGH